jgi:ADP-ribosylglycohydrolase
MKKVDNENRFAGAFLGFAIGDAYGYPIRDDSFAEICERFESKGCLDLAVSKKSGFAQFTDATQMMLFTTDGILWADKESQGKAINYVQYIFYCLQYWLYTQEKKIADRAYMFLFDEKLPYKSRLMKVKGLYQTRYSDKSCIDALYQCKNEKYGTPGNKMNNNTSAGGLKRVLPVGLYFNYDTETAFKMGAAAAAITHGDPSAYLSGGVYSAVIAEIINGETIDNAIKKAMKILKTNANSDELMIMLNKTVEYIENEDMPVRQALDNIGKGEKASEALCIALFCSAVKADGLFRHAIQMAANHDGASDVCGALTGGILGAYHGDVCIPKKWIKKIQFYNLLMDMQESLIGRTTFSVKDEE